MLSLTLSRFSLLGRLTVALASLGLVGCVNYSPVTEPGDKFAGLYARTKDSPLTRVFIIHGMGTEPAGYSTDLVNKLAAKLNFTPVAADAQGDSHPIRWGDEDTLARLQIFHLLEKNGGAKRMVVYEYWWSPITTPVKTTGLGYDSAIARAKFNKDIKLKVVDDGLSDVVLYLNNYSDGILKKAAVVALGEFLARKYDTSAEVPNSEEVAFFSSSLGSIMLFDALKSYASNYAVKLNHFQENAVPTEPANSPRLTAELKTLALNYDPHSDLTAQTIAHTGLFVMFANQLPLLKLSDSAWKSTFIENLELLKGSNAGVLDIVAMSDPNDLLSYRLEVGKSDRIHFHNVAPHNAWDFFGLFENPVKAHSGYYGKDKTVDIIIDGLK